MSTHPSNPLALITGASRGIGLAIARAMWQAGYRPLLCARPSIDLEAAAAETNGIALPADLRNPNAPTEVLERARQHGQVRILVNNAGTAPSARVEDTTDEFLDETLDLHAKAPLRFARALVPSMRETGGTIIQLASTAGLRGFPFVSAYVMAKHAMVGLTRALAAELPSNMRTYAVCPGFVDTEITRKAAAAIAERSGKPLGEITRQFAAMNRIGRLHTTTEVAAAVAELLGPDQPASGTIVDLDTP